MSIQAFKYLSPLVIYIGTFRSFSVTGFKVWLPLVLAYLASRKYQLLRHHDNSPQIPTGYPGMMLLSLFPPPGST